MTKIHYQEANSKQREDVVGIDNVFKLQQTDFNSVVYTKALGTFTIEAADTDRLMIIVTGFANTTDTKQQLRDGNIVEIPKGQSLRIRGKVEYYLVG